jgi:phosphatidylinositol glycan class S
VAALVDSALGHLAAAASFFGKGQTKEAVIDAHLAFHDSEKAFFDKSMVGQVYFPDEHKVAVYLPLLGPVGVPLAVALLREFRRWISALRR